MEVLIFILAMSQAAAKPFNALWRPDSEEVSKTKSSWKMQSTKFVSSDCYTLIHSSELVHPVHINYEKERWQNTPLPKTNTHMKWLWLFTIYTNKNFRPTVKWLYGHQQTPINYATFLQHSSKRISRNLVKCLFRLFYINKACEYILWILQGFLQDLSQSENLVRGVATWTKTALAVFQFRNAKKLTSLFRGIFLKYLIYIFFGRLRSDIPR